MVMDMTTGSPIRRILRFFIPILLGNLLQQLYSMTDSAIVSHTLGIEVSFGSALFLGIIATLGACGASGVAGGSLLLIPMACSFFGIPNDVAMQAVAVGFIVGVIQDSVETALNSSGDAFFTATAELYDRKKRGESGVNDEL